MQLPGMGGGNGNSYSLGWVGLDGHDVFQVAAPSSTLGQRRREIHNNLQEIRDDYLQMSDPIADIATRQTEEGQPQVFVNGEYLMTVTQEDANLQGTTASGVLQQLRKTIPRVLEQSYRERQPEYRRRQFLYVGTVVGLAVLIMVLLRVMADRLLRWGMASLGTALHQGDMTEDQRHHLRDIRQLLLPVLQFSVLAIAVLWSMGRFPETRILQQDLLSTLKVPIIVLIVVVIAYVGIRLTYAVVDRLLINLTDEDGWSGNYSRRTRLRISTLSSVIKNIANFVWIAIGFILALWITGVDLGLLLASIGIIGLALSLATQNLVQGAIRGFFIVLEDQFAIGDVVKIGEDAGVVENLNLRITQLRDTAGRLITIPTSDIARVANYSLHWSQADLKIPVHYNADIDQMIDITRQVSQEMRQDTDWGELILEEPQILGVDDFGDSAIILRVWIKTLPMKQWDVSREFRRRFKLAIADTDTTIPFPQRDVWLYPSEELLSTLRHDSSEKEKPDSSNGNGNGRQPRSRARTDRQPRNVPDDADGNDVDGDE